MKHKKLGNIWPFLITAAILVYTWYQIIANNYFITRKHWIALVLFLVTTFFYFVNFRITTILAGVLLLTATFNLSALLPDIAATSFFLRFGETEINTPAVQWQPLLLLIAFLFFNYNYLFRPQISSSMKNQD